MTLATRCPDCKTLNPTTAAMLQAQNGHITCGHCGSLFSGIDHLTPADEDSWTSLQAEAIDKGLLADKTGDDGSTDASADDATANTSQARLTRLGKWRPRMPAVITRLLEPMSAWPRFARRWTVGMALVLLLQLVWWQRLAIAGTLPFLSPALAAWSSLLGSDLAGAPSSRLKIMASSLKSAQDNRLQLEVRVQNNGKTPSRWPLLDLQLLDSKRETVTSISLGVRDYAVVGMQDIPRILKPGQDAELIAWVDTEVLNAQSLELPVTGFKVSIVDKIPSSHERAAHADPDKH